MEINAQLVFYLNILKNHYRYWDDVLFINIMENDMSLIFY